MPMVATEDIYMVLLVLTTLIVLNIAAVYIPALTILQMIVQVMVVTYEYLVLEVRH